jgi:hypothetical protein|tara:strand:- start:286 stop:558 length:273 start_codon:yes stop_codon:yes gene_type:complete
MNKCPRCAWETKRDEDGDGICTNTSCTWPYPASVITDGMVILEYIEWLERQFGAMQRAHNFRWSPRMYFENIDLLNASIVYDDGQWEITE